MSQLSTAPVLDEVPGTAPATPTATESAGGAGANGRHRRSRTTWSRRRQVLVIAPALVAAVGLAGVLVGPEFAHADAPATTEDSVAVAAALGVDDAQPPSSVDVDARRLAAIAGSRGEREAEQEAAAQTQAQADTVAAAAIAEAARPKTVLPVQGARLTSTFGMRWGVLHAGIDLAAPMGTPEYAAADGVVLEAGPATGYGLAVYIQHQDGDVTVYGHMDQILVSAGQVVRAGDLIALLGNRGESTGPHLHFEVHAGGLGGQAIDPIPWLAARGVQV